MQATAYAVGAGDSTAFGFITKLTSLGYRVTAASCASTVLMSRAVPCSGDWDMGIAADIVRAWLRRARARQRRR